MTTKTQVNAHVHMNIVEPADSLANSDAPLGKAYITVNCKDTNGEPVTVAFTLNTLGMMGGAAKGAADRFGYKWD